MMKHSEIQNQKMAKFNGNGYLEPGIHAMSEDEVKSDFVDAFPTSTTREKIHKGYIRHGAELEAIGIGGEKYLDGSFTTMKTDPGDIDMVVFADADLLDALPADVQQKFRALVAGKVTQQSHMCDCYFCPTVKDEQHPAFDQLRAQRKYWLGEFCFDRSDQPKGIVSVKVQP
jgi:hypothetical protein